MRDILQKFKKLGNLVVDVFGGTISVVKACLLLPEHGRFIEYEVDASCVIEAMLPLISICNPRMLSNE